MDQIRRKEITVNALLGQALGDACGVPLEFRSRAEVRALHLQEAQDGGLAHLSDSRWAAIPPGAWSDDTSMALASMDAIIRCDGRIDYEEQMKAFVRWWYEGEYCSLAVPFGLGGIVSQALERYRNGIPALECGGKGFMDNGNGALMRILPISLWCIFRGLSIDETVTVTGNASAITHAHEISRMCCLIWTELLRALTEGKNVEDAVDVIESLPYGKWFSADTLEKLSFVTDKKICRISEFDIGETGYVADTLYSALYSILHADTFRDSILNAVNLGGDTDTAAAVTGTAAGILYGRGNMPESWMQVLRKKEYLESLAIRFAKRVNGDGSH